MRKGSVVVFLLGLLAVLWMASPVAADPRFHGHSGAGRLGGSGSFHKHGHSFHKHGSSFHKHGFHGHRFFPRHFGVVVAPPLVVYSPPLFDPFPSYYGAPVYAPPVIPPAVYAPPVSPPVMYSPPAFTQPAPPPAPQVVQYPNGRYELRGDGIRTPYTWVWIPNPPPPPPAPPSAPPAVTPDGAPTSGDAPETRQHVYHWVDEQGVAHWTNRLESVPQRYREVAKRFEPS